jgi:hypothetical protein
LALLESPKININPRLILNIQIQSFVPTTFMV